MRVGIGRRRNESISAATMAAEHRLKVQINYNDYAKKKRKHEGERRFAFKWKIRGNVQWKPRSLINAGVAR